MSMSVEFNQTDVLSRPRSERSKVSGLFQGWRQRVKTHHYQASNMGLDFSLERSAIDPREIQIISQKPGVKKDDCIKIHNSSECTAYKILEIDFYSDPSDMWIARLAVLLDE